MMNNIMGAGVLKSSLGMARFKVRLWFPVNVSTPSWKDRKNASLGTKRSPKMVQI